VSVPSLHPGLLIPLMESPTRACFPHIKPCLRQSAPSLPDGSATQRDTVTLQVYIAWLGCVRPTNDHEWASKSKVPPLLGGGLLRTLDAQVRASSIALVTLPEVVACMRAAPTPPCLPWCLVPQPLSSSRLLLIAAAAAATVAREGPCVPH